MYIYCVFNALGAGKYVRLQKIETKSENGDRLHFHICGHGHDATVVLSGGHQDVSVVAPVGGPRVLHQPVVLAIDGAITHGQHGMVESIHVVLAFRLVVHTMGVEAEGLG